MEHSLVIDKLNGHDTIGKIGKVFFKSGDNIKVNDIIFTIESGKGSLKYKSLYDGVLKLLNIQTGDIVKKNQEIGMIDGEKGEMKTKKAYSFGMSKAEKKELNPDVLIIGGGPGGYVAAIRSAQLGQSVVLIEEDKLGGTCLNYGCIPTKTLVHSTKVLNHIKEASDYGIDVIDFKINIEKIISRKQEVVETLVGGIDHLMTVNDIEVINGSAVVLDLNTIVVKNKKIEATIKFKNLIIATGSEPSTIPIEGHDILSIMTSKDALEITEIPKSITIIGGGVIGMEFAFIFNGLGSEVNVIEFMPEILSVLDQDVIDVLKESAIEKGIKIYSGACAKSINKTENNQMVISYVKEDKTYFIASQKVLMAVGRKARVDSIDLNLLGVKLNVKKNGISVNKKMQTNIENIYAIGDVTNILQLAHVASHQGMVASEVISGLDTQMHYDVVPSGIFTTPEIGSVGITEKEAIEKGLDFKISKFYFASNGKALAMNETSGFVKIIYDNSKNYIIGGVIVGPNATDMIATITNLINQKTTLEEAVKVIYAHPTAAESVHEALLGLDERGIHNG